MGKRGPKPETVERLRLLGSSAQYKRQGEPAIVPGEPVKPAGLGEHGSGLWDRQVERLRNQGIISPAWQETLAVLCRLWDEVNESLTDGSERKERIATMQAFWKAAQDFGLTPSSKAGIRTEPGLPKNRKGYIKRA